MKIIFRTLSKRPKGVVLPSLDDDFDKTMFENGFGNVGHRNVVNRDVIVVRNARKSYGRGKARHEVLKGIDITIKEGSM